MRVVEHPFVWHSVNPTSSSCMFYHDHMCWIVSCLSVFPFALVQVQIIHGYFRRPVANIDVWNHHCLSSLGWVLNPQCPNCQTIIAPWVVGNVCCLVPLDLFSDWFWWRFGNRWLFVHLPILIVKVFLDLFLQLLIFLVQWLHTLVFAIILVLVEVIRAEHTIVILVHSALEVTRQLL